MYGFTQTIQKKLTEMPQPELLWPFSNPPYIRSAKDIPDGTFDPNKAYERDYRKHIEDRYGKYKMCLCGIHVNFSFADELLEADFACSDFTDKPIKINKYLEEFVAHSCANPHGWGFAVFKNNKVTVHKNAEDASQSEEVKAFMQEEIWVDKFMAHIRLGTRGVRTYLNCHPFTGIDCKGRSWTLQHNGTIFTNILDEYEYLQVGETDSERIFLCLLDNVNQAEAKVGRDLTPQERFELVDKLILKLVPDNKVNLMICDGEFMYVHCNYLNTLYEKLDGEAKIFATVPLDEEGWQPIPFMQLVVYKDAEMVFKGTRHECEYIFDPSHYVGISI